MDASLQDLNDAQRSAVTSPANVVQVLAPPGSGKTKTLTARVAYLINHERLQPWNIIVCTFTIKAAREMKERIRSFVGDGIEAKLILGTFHSIARRFLVRYGQEIGIDKNFGIADTSDSTSIIKRIITRYQYQVDPSQARSRISGLKSKGIIADGFVGTTKKIDQQEFALVYSAYEEHLKASNLLDYDDLLLRCVELLERQPTCVSSIQAVLIDEYQDTNNVQYELMKLMAQRMRRITIVGDPDQSIYSFRSAEIKNLYRMQQDYKDTVVINLENNYRSSGCILSSAMAVIEQDETRPSKSLIATHCVGEQPTLRHLATANTEAQWIVEEIERTKILTAGLLNFNDFAILLRSAALSLSIERALGKAGIPYRMVGGRRFFDRAEIKIVLDYLRIINQPDHNDALVRVINLPSRKIGDTTVKALLEEAELKKTSLWKVVLDFAQGRNKPQTKISSQAQKGIDSFVNLILTSRKKLLPLEGEQCDLYDLINHILQKISFEAYLKQTHKENWRERWANVEELVAQATQMATTITEGKEVADDALPVVEGIEQRKDTAADLLSKFLANVALSTEVEKEEGAELNQVTISTIHAAKGLEWPIVFIPAVYNGSIPHSRAEDHDEERRLLYVGMTRAQALLYLSCPVKQSAQEDTSLSRFISSRSVQKFFSLKGPSIGCSVIQDLAQILRRPCPLGQNVDDARHLLERIDDDKYPLHREEVSSQDTPRDPLWDNSKASGDGPHLEWKRRKLEHPTSLSRSSASTTMQNPSSFSIATTILPNGRDGFTSARDIKAIQDEAEAIQMLASARDAALGKTKYRNVKTVRTQAIKPRVPGQGAITNFFGKSRNLVVKEAEVSERPMPSLQCTQSTLIQHTPLNDVLNAQTSAPPYVRPYVSPASSSFTSHRPRSVPMPFKPKRAEAEPSTENQRYVLLSSSPAKPDDDKPQRFSDKEDEVSIPTSPSKQHSSSFIPQPGFRPASTFHNTSVGQLQDQSGPQRKTLGMRRTMQGWSVKHSQPPRPRQS